MKILIFGGTGSLGYELVRRWLPEDHVIYVYSRDECKQWKMKMEYPNINFLVGDVINRDLVKLQIDRVKPDTVIIASAMKHIDICEHNMEACINNNLLGIKNVLDSIDESVQKRVLFISSDKACSPVNAYGMCKALCERFILEKSRYCKTDCRYIAVRYGNVLNSRGSIIPILHKIGQDSEQDNFSLTHPNMTRFIMTLKDAGNLIDYALENAKTGEIIVPKLKSMRISDLLDIFSLKYSKPVKNTGIRIGEKLSESLINATQSNMLSYGVHKGRVYYHIGTSILHNKPEDYDSDSCLIDKTELCDLLEQNELL